MASSFSTDLKLELMVTGENAGTWGDNTNNNLNLIQQAIAGFEQVTLSSGGTLALAMTDKTISNARNMVIKFATATIAASTICTIPDSIEKFYIFDATGLTNPSNLTIKTASGTGFTLDAAKIYAAYSDGTNLKEISLDTLGGTIGTAHIADDAVTLAKMAPGTDGNIISYDASGNPVAVATGNAGQVLTSAGAGAVPSFQDPAAGGSVSWQTGSIKTANFTAAAGEGYFVNTTSGAITVTLPSSPSAGDIVAVKDYAGTFVDNKVTVARNSSNIDGVAQDGILDENNLAVTFIYIDGTQGWKSINSDAGTYGPGFIQASGGEETICGDFKIHTFNGPGIFNVTRVGNPSGSTVVDYMVIAGGGSGGPNSQAGGGGAGGFRESHSTPVSGSYTASPLATPTGVTVAAQAYPISIGAGGTGPGAPATGYKGTPSVALGITSAGGGGGGISGGAGSAGGSGGGGGENGSGGSGNSPPVSPAQGNNGGSSSHPSGAGGGGAGAAGGNTGGQNGGNGGTGATTEITGAPQTFAGGGGGGGYSPSGSGGNPGPGGGGQGGDYNNAERSGFAGAMNTGGGGGGNGWPTPGAGGFGGSGKVVIRYKYR